jgi:hypothetical protein
VARLRHLVVVVPGIGGSVLADAAEASMAASPRYALSVSSLAGLVAHPALLDIDRYPDLTPSALVSDLVALPPLWTLPGYQRLRLHLNNAFPDRDAPVVVGTFRSQDAATAANADVILMPYDFRRSIVDAAHRLDVAVAQALYHRPRPGLDRPVIVMAHSLGGLVARYWVAVLGGWQSCQVLITLGTPARGAPKAAEWLVNGAGRRGLRHPWLTAVIRKWPSMYELLPQYPAVWNAAAGEAMELTELPPSLLAARPALTRYAEHFRRMTGDATRVHQQLTAQWALMVGEGRAPAVVPFFSRGHATPNLLTLTTSGRLRISKDDPPWRGNEGWAGDGTVPALCAIPPDLNDRRDLWRVLSAKHGPLGTVAEPMQLLRSYAGDTIPIRGEQLPAQPWLGLDVDEFASGGQELAIRVRLLPAGIVGETADLILSPLDHAASPIWRARLSRATGNEDGQSWHGTVPPRPPGRYELSVEVSGVPGHGRISATDTIIVVDDHAGADTAWVGDDVDDVVTELG